MIMRAVLLAAVLVSLTACKQQAEPTGAASPAVAAKPVAPPPPAGRQVVANYMAAWNAHDPQLTGDFFAKDAVYVDATIGAPQSGREAITDNVIKAFLRAVPDCKWELRSEPVASGDGVAFEWTLSGTNTGGWSYGVAATNQKLNLHGVSFVRIRDGKIVYEGRYYDGITMNKQMGW